MNYAALREANPWWETKDMGQDQKIREWQESPMGYKPRLMREFEYDFEPNNTVVYTLRGARQVGKTTMIKLQIQSFLESGVCPWNIFYYSFDTTDSKSELAEIIRLYMKRSKKHRDSGRTYLFLDEITSVSEWQKGIKWLVDNNVLANCTVLATGSQADRILNAAERLQGRRGRVTTPYDMLLAPMRFAEFVSAQNKEIKDLASKERLPDAGRRRDMLRQLSNKSVPKEMDFYDGFVDELNEHLYEYLLTGGMPKVIDEKSRTGVIPDYMYADYMDGVQGDWGSKNKSLMKEFARAVADSQCSSTTWHNLQQQTEIGSWSTIQDYALFLKDMAILSVVYKYGEKRKVARISQEKKLYFHDPFYTHMFRSWVDSKSPFTAAEKLLADEASFGCMVEGVVADHLIRWAFDLAENKMEFDYSNHVFFWKDRQGREVDFVMYHEGAYEIPVEVKYRKQVNAKQLGGLFGFLDQVGSRGGLVLSRDLLEERRDYVVIPASVFLMLI